MRLAARRSPSVHCLFLISSDFMFFSRTGRDDPDDFFAMIVLPIRVNDQQHRSRAGRNSSRAECMPSFLPRPAVYAVCTDEAVFVFKDERGQFKRDSFVFRWFRRFFDSSHS